MRCSVFAAALVGIFSTAVAAQPADLHMRSTKVQHGPAFPDLQARYDPTSGDHLIRGGPSRTRRSVAGANVQNVQNQADLQAGSIRTKAFNIISAFQGGLGGPANGISDLCSQVKGDKLRDAQFLSETAGQLKIHLEAILDLVTSAHGGIQGCGGGPFPSQGYSNPPSNESICSLILEILFTCHACFSALIVVCVRCPIISIVCSPCLIDIAGHLCGWVQSCNSVIPAAGVLGFLRSGLGGGFALGGFGFDPLTSLLQ